MRVLTNNTLYRPHYRLLDIGKLAVEAAFLLRAYKNGSLRYETVSEILNVFCWEVSDSHGRYDPRMRWWSEGAAKLLLEVNGKYPRGLVIQDHVVPRKVISDLIFLNPTAPNIKNSLELSFCCIITRQEDSEWGELIQSMPSDWDQLDPWARYKKRNINVVSFPLANSRLSHD